MNRGTWRASRAMLQPAMRGTRSRLPLIGALHRLRQLSRVSRLVQPGSAAPALPPGMGSITKLWIHATMGVEGTKSWPGRPRPTLPRQPGYLRTFHVGPGSGVDTDEIPGLDEQRDLDLGAGFQPRGLGRARNCVAFEPRVCVRH